MKKHYLLNTLLFLTVFTALISCGTDDSDTYLNVPDVNDTIDTENPDLIIDLNALPFERLSDYNFFEGDLKNLQPAESVLPYDLNSSLFSDYALKKRFVWMPQGNSAKYTADGEVLDFPTGSILIKNFYYDSITPSNSQYIIETRLMIKKAEGWIFANYVWNDEQNEAFFNLQGNVKRISWIQDGVQMSGDYTIPSELQCATCHNLNGSNTLIGPKPQNLNKTFNYADGAQNQLGKWIQQGYLESAPSQINSTVNWEDTSYPLDIRARSYLDINCAHCHSENTSCGYTPMDLAFSKTNNPVNLGACVEPIDYVSGTQQYIIEKQNAEQSLLHFRMNTNIPSERMPTIGRNVIDTKAVTLIENWINSMEEPCL